MKKTILVYFLLITLIAFLAFVLNAHWLQNLSINFSYPLHIAIESLITIVIFSIFIKSNNLYTKTKNERYAILAGAFLLSAVLNIIHILTAKYFPYDSLSIGNIIRNNALIYLLLCNIIMPLSIYIALIYKPSVEVVSNFRFKTYSLYFYILLAFVIAHIFVHNFLSGFVNNFVILAHSLECINYALFIIIGAILINMNYREEKYCSNTLISGLIIFGLSGLFFMNPSPIQLGSILAHIFQVIGLVLILKGLPCIQTFSQQFKFKDELVAYLSLLLIAFYICFVSIIYGALHIILPPITAYVFIEYLLFFQFIIYVIATLSWQNVVDVYAMAEYQQSIVRTYDTLQRITNLNVVKDTIINEIKKYFDADKCFITLYNKEENKFYLDKYYQNLPSQTLHDFETEDKDSLEFEEFSNTFHNLEICFSNVDEYINKNSLKNSPQEKILKQYNIKSYYSLPINYNNVFLGYLILQYRGEYKELSPKDLSYLSRMANQISIAIGKTKN